MALDGIVFDMDGTLIDTNAAHVEAWRRAFDQHGYRVEPDRIFIEVGKGGDKLVPSVLGQSAYREHGESLSAAHTEAFGNVARERGLNVFPGARELLDGVRGRGLKTVLATSSGQGHLKTVREIAGFAPEDFVDELVTADDTEQSKPAPDLVTAAAKKLNLSPAQCAMIGDTPYDVEAAKHAGVVCLGLTCGGHTPDTLTRAGARGVWRDPADLLGRWDEATHIASPGRAHLTWDLLHDLMRQALDAARDGMDGGEIPIGCVLADGDGNVIARGFNEQNRRQDRTAHAEMVTFGRAAGRAPTDARDLVLVSTLEPCVMCLGASMEAAVDTIVYGLKAPADSGTGRVAPPQSPESQMPRIVGDVMSAESRSLFERWIAKPGDNPRQVQFVRQLLALTGGA